MLLFGLVASWWIVTAGCVLAMCRVAAAGDTGSRQTGADAAAGRGGISLSVPSRPRRPSVAWSFSQQPERPAYVWSLPLRGGRDVRGDPHPLR